MATLQERFLESDQRENMERAQWLMRDPRFRDELLRYLVSIWDRSLIQELYGIDSPNITEQRVQIIIEQVRIILPDENRLYVGNSRIAKWLNIENLSHEEISFLIQAFITDTSDRDYIVWLIFHNHNFLNQKQTDFMDVLESSENLFRVAFQKKKQILHLVDNTELATDLPEAANDSHYTLLSERIENIEPGYYEYLHTIYRERLHFVESLFSQIVMFLAESEKNHIWALDPANHSFHIPAYIQNKINLISSICEFHRTLDPDYPLLHNLLEWTVRSWILIYKWFSSPAEQLRTR